ncbi:DUF2127 domain-containing protein [Amycolatopsis sp.]|uniref:DUF2127 domain-containing protein n=1 Tax=Amycolatopsis sp. TaxID=37632 RepID=UPI002BCBE851|nr:DUF2127 domain-containing protein [Amycolatopsis sp.]HVV13884.1 DUF2127 domain-containing protein [Amycolatopsis sp.]
MIGEDELRPPPGTDGRRGWLVYELIGCARHGHLLAGRDAAHIRRQDEMIVRESGGLRWHRCLRCDSWLPLPVPENPAREFCPAPDELDIPPRGKLLRDRYVLRLIALDRLLHFLVLAVLAAGVFVFAHERDALSGPFFRIIDAVQGALGGRTGESGQGMLGELTKAFAARSSTIWIIGGVVACYAVLEGVEAIGLWLARRWAEYLTFVATAVLLVPELYELSHRVSVLKILTLLVNLAVVIYLLFAKRLFGLRGGGRAEEAERERDSGLQALERVQPGGRFRE